MNDLASQVAAGSAALGVPLTDAQCQQLACYAQLLLKWNSVHNLTAIDSPAHVLTHHLLDSLALVPPLQRLVAGKAARVLDVGSGGGLPGVPLAIALPQLQVTLIDKVQKKTAFLAQAKLELQLANIEPVHARVEAFKPAQPFDLIVSRAFSSLNDFVSLTQHVLAADGVWLAMKGAVPTNEVKALPPWARVQHTTALHIPGLSAQRHLIEIRPTE